MTTKVVPVKDKMNARDTLLRVMIDTLDEVGEPGVRLEKILKDANVSVSSMYHHYGSLGGLIEAAHLHRFRSTQAIDLEFFLAALKSIKSQKEFRVLVSDLLDRMFSDARRVVRSQRINAVARSYKNPQFAEALADVQRDANKAVATGIMTAQAKGFIPTTIDPEEAAVWWTTTTFSRYFLEILEDAEQEKKWNTTARRSIFAAIGLSE